MLNPAVVIDQQFRLVAFVEWVKGDAVGREVVRVFVNVDHEAKLSAYFWSRHVKGNSPQKSLSLQLRSTHVARCDKGQDIVVH